MTDFPLNRFTIRISIFAFLFGISFSLTGQDKREVLVANYFKKGTTLAFEEKYDEALKIADEFETVVADEKLASELRGIINTYAKRYKDAKAAFLRVQELDPDSHVATFNLAELEFLQGNFKEAAKAFEKIDGKQRGKMDDVADLARYKWVLCEIRKTYEPKEVTKTESARKIGDVIKGGGENPSFYFVQAAIAFAEQRFDEAQQWIDRSGEFFNPSQNDVYLDSFLEFGWVKQNDIGRPEISMPELPLGKIAATKPKEGANVVAKADSVKGSPKGDGVEPADSTASTKGKSTSYSEASEKLGVPLPEGAVAMARKVEGPPKEDEESAEKEDAPKAHGKKEESKSKKNFLKSLFKKEE